jgi:hypothetical protein
MVASDFQYGCLMQNLANELPALDAALTKRVARGFADSTEIVAGHAKRRLEEVRSGAVKPVPWED